MLFKAWTEVPLRERKCFELKFWIVGELQFFVDWFTIFYRLQLINLTLVLSKAQTKIISRERKCSGWIWDSRQALVKWYCTKWRTYGWPQCAFEAGARLLKLESFFYVLEENLQLLRSTLVCKMFVYVFPLWSYEWWRRKNKKKQYLRFDFPTLQVVLHLDSEVLLVYFLPCFSLV